MAPTVLFSIAAVLVLVVGPAQSGIGSWSPSHGPWVWPGIGALVDPHNPQTLFAAAEDAIEPSRHVYRSTSAGHSWRELDAGRAPTGVEALALNPRDLSNMYRKPGIH